jgi:TPP-dependent pyruvate/acetoin dehydrogenase alpha subunit
LVRRRVLDDAALTALEAEVAEEVAEAATWAEVQPDAEPHEALRQTWAEFDATVPAWVG